MKLLSVAALSLAVGDVSAHYIFQQLSVGGTKYPVFQYIRKNSNYNSPVTDLSSNDLRCNVGASGSGTETVSVRAGDSVWLSWSTGFSCDLCSSLTAPRSPSLLTRPFIIRDRCRCKSDPDESTTSHGQ
jgi:hypothetical protein